MARRSCSFRGPGRRAQRHSRARAAGTPPPRHETTFPGDSAFGGALVVSWVRVSRRVTRTGNERTLCRGRQDRGRHGGDVVRSDTASGSSCRAPHPRARPCACRIRHLLPGPAHTPPALRWAPAPISGHNLTTNTCPRGHALLFASQRLVSPCAGSGACTSEQRAERHPRRPHAHPAPVVTQTSASRTPPRRVM